MPVGNIPKPPVYRVFWLQLLISLSAGLIFLLESKLAAMSAILGGLVYALPHLYFTYKSFSRMGARATPVIVSNIYQGETVKLISIAALFALIFRFMPQVELFALFITFILVMFCHFLTPVLVRSR